MKRNKKTDDMPKEKQNKLKKGVLIGIALAVFIIYVLPERKKEPTVHDDILEMMDNALDSLVKTQGIEDYEIIHKGEKEEFYGLQQYDEEDSLDVIEMRIQMIQTLPGLNDKERIKRLEDIIARRDSLEAVLKIKKAIPDEVKIISRRIRIKTPEGKEYAFFQQLRNGQMVMKYFIETNTEENRKLILDIQ